MTNTDKLKAAIKASGYSQLDVATALGINESTLYRKLERNCESFTVQQAGIIADMLKLSVTEMHDIFFAEELA